MDEKKKYIWRKIFLPPKLLRGKHFFRLFRCFSKFYCWFLTFIKGGKSACPEVILAGKKFLQNFIFFHPFESINFQPAGFLAFKEKSGPLLHPYYKIIFHNFTTHIQLYKVVLYCFVILLFIFIFIQNFNGIQHYFTQLHYTHTHCIK